ncbi:hypothetical protein ACOBQJ_08580 [Pelotomaculum propionicicum]|uniref:hypothetical protein n=1 Tax=Pelotomaculum propionicicum TaxID=258475 RepID=UPI003B777790
MVKETSVLEKSARCLSAKCHFLKFSKCSSLDVPLESVTDCSNWQGREGFIEIRGQRIITDPYGYLHNYPETVISFHKNGIYINKNVTNLLDYCKTNYPPMCWKNFKQYNQHIYQDEYDMKESYENTDVYISPQKVGFYDEGKFIRLDNIDIKSFVENYLRFINYDFGKDTPPKK